MTKELLQSRINEDYVKTFIEDINNVSINNTNINNKAIMILGHGRAGKDTLAEYLAKYYGYRFLGTSSTVLCKYIYPESPELMYSCRHEFKKQLFEFGNIIRDIDPRFIPWMTIKDGSDLLVGLRSSLDISAALDSCVKLCIWVHSEVEDDPTMDYDLSWLMTACMKGTRTIGRVEHEQIKRLKEMYEQIFGEDTFGETGQSINHNKIPLYFINNPKDPLGKGLIYFHSQIKELVHYLKAAND